MFENIVFFSPIFGIIGLIVWLWALYLYYKAFSFSQKFKFLSDLQHVFWSGKKYFYTYMTFSIILILLFSLLLSHPHKTFTRNVESKEWIDIVLALDLSYSMLAEDISPNRFEKSKEVLLDFISQVQTDRVGIVLFAGKPFVWVPLTFDYNFLQDYIKNLSVDTINQNYAHLQWTAIGDAMLYGWNMFDEEEREKVMVLFTDGEANRWIRPLDALRLIREQNIMTHTVWIGWFEKTFVEFTNIYGKQRVEIWWIDEEVLQSIANITWWKYFRASDEKSFESLFDELDILEKKPILQENITLYESLHKEIILMLSFVFLLFLSFQGWYFIKN